MLTSNYYSEKEQIVHVITFKVKITMIVRRVRLFKSKSLNPGLFQYISLRNYLLLMVKKVRDVKKTKDTKQIFKNTTKFDSDKFSLVVLL